MLILDKFFLIPRSRKTTFKKPTLFRVDVGMQLESKCQIKRLKSFIIILLRKFTTVNIGEFN